eukprot:CAMPEP_0183716104 /NCGR_PEP_ID=MMETSP0737-20130205/10124_1 /TAXON_ID=385413 /ORGANISM="Thalassiosira miniscula, Strain CCMP1093" /LENGTH=107 /DNA_ID=CAMNT_0025945315 /DNA_START=80 /DNA_END=403 /DNA_ORIENTATION=-
MLPPMFDTVKHGSVSQHLRKDDEYDLGTTDVNLIDYTLRSRLRAEDNGLFEVEIHHVFGFEEEAADQFPPFGFYCNDGTFGIVKEDDGDAHPVISNDGHGSSLLWLC